MENTPLTFRLNLPHAAVAEERAVASRNYEVGQESPLPPDPDAVEARFVDPVTLLVVGTLAVLVERIVNHFLVRDGRGVLIDARGKPPVVSRLEDVPEGFVVLLKPDGSTQTIAAGKNDEATILAVLKPCLGAAK